MVLTPSFKVGEVGVATGSRHFGAARNRWVNCCMQNGGSSHDLTNPFVQSYVFTFHIIRIKDRDEKAYNRNIAVARFGILRGRMGAPGVALGATAQFRLKRMRERREI